MARETVWKFWKFGDYSHLPASISSRSESVNCSAEGWHSCPPCQWGEKGGELRAVPSHRIGLADRNVRPPYFGYSAPDEAGKASVGKKI